MAGTEVARPGLISRTVTYYNEIMVEMRKVTWPDRVQIRSLTIQITIFVLVIGAIIGLMDLFMQGVLIRLPDALLR